MYLVLIAWLYVALMMAVAEATSPVGSLLGAFVTFLFYGVLPMSVVAYILGAPARKQRRKALEAQTASSDREEKASATQPNTSCEPPSHAIAPIREKF